ncbi:MAG: DEAD/DEAH box helicase [Candidatus Nanopelagicales bacterium]
MLGDLAREVALDDLSTDDESALARLTQNLPSTLEAARAAAGLRRLFSGRDKKESADSALADLVEYRDRAEAAELPRRLERLEVGVHSQAPDIAVGDALSTRVGLSARLDEDSDSADVITAAEFAGLSDALSAVARAADIDRSARAAVASAADKVRADEVRRLLSQVPVELLRDVANGQIRTTAVSAAGLRTVQDVLDNGKLLAFADGVGDKTKDRVRAAARTLRQITFDETPVRLDIQARTAEASELLRRLGAWDAIRRALGDSRALARAAQLTPLSTVLDSSVSHLVAFPGSEPASSLRESMRDAVSRGRALKGISAATATATDPWDDFFARPADYYALLSELGILTEGEGKEHGDLPEDIIDAIRAFTIRGDHLTASLRGYQSFGARFALVQQKVILGDEMGLGKTIEALAVLAHLRATGDHHFLVICPAAVVTNWTREVASKSTLKPHRVYGFDRERAAHLWVRNGGVAVTTFETLAWLNYNGPQWPELGCVVVDEAHYIKNPDAKRTQRTLEVLKLTDRAILLTGTPLENRIQEFANLVGYLRPDLTLDASGLAPRRFRTQVAPAYLRRNQEDVLTELPELVEVDEWLDMTDDDLAEYRQAVAEGNFMAMRRAAMTQGGQSRKVQRLLEIVQEAEDNGRRVIVYSYFRDVLAQLASQLPGEVFGPITGSVAAASRQEIVDRFSAARGGAVLVAQVQAGGVGLNIQAASVVVICEPQLKPTTEWQAIARARRMGQLNSVQVHRLLSSGAVDERIVEILATKSQLFDEFARISETAEAAPEAVDISDGELSRLVVAAERERLFGAAAEAVDGGSSGRG